MKNLLILIAFAAVYLHFFPEPKIDAWFAEKKEEAITGFNSVTNTKVKLSTKRVYEDLQQQFEHFSDEEIDYIGELTSEQKKLTSFFFKHCEPYKQNYKFQTKNQRKVCKGIGNYRQFF